MKSDLYMLKIADYDAWLEADNAFHANLERQFGKLAGDMRYRSHDNFDAATLEAYKRFALLRDLYHLNWGIS